MSDDSVDARLRALAQLSREYFDSAEGRRDMEKRVREARRAAVVDMSAEAVDARLRELSEMSRLCASLARARRSQR